MAKNRKARRLPGKPGAAMMRRERTSEDRSAIVEAIVHGVVSLVAIGFAWWLVMNGHDAGAVLAAVAGVLAGVMPAKR